MVCCEIYHNDKEFVLIEADKFDRRLIRAEYHLEDIMDQMNQLRWLERLWSRDFYLFLGQ